MEATSFKTIEHVWPCSLKKKLSHFKMGVHYFFHKTSLIVIILFELKLVHWLEVASQNLYPFFFHSLKKFLEFQNLENFINTKSNKLLGNVKTKWISMFFLAKWVYDKYCLLIVKMHVKTFKSDRLWNIWMRCLMLDSFWGCLISCHCFDVCIC